MRMTQACLRRVLRRISRAELRSVALHEIEVLPEDTTDVHNDVRVDAIAVVVMQNMPGTIRQSSGSGDAARRTRIELGNSSHERGMDGRLPGCGMVRMLVFPMRCQ